MKKNLLVLVLVQGLLAMSGQAARSQALWVPAAGAPNFYANGGIVSSSGLLHRTLPNVLWGTFYQNTGLGTSSTRLYMSTDNGQTWQTQTVASTGRDGASGARSGETVVQTAVLDGRHAWLLTQSAANGALALKRTVSGINGFTALAAPLPTSFSGIHFFTATAGIAIAGTSVVYRTTDGGDTWVNAAAIPSYATAANDAVASVQGIGNSVWITTANGALLRTADGGLTWTAAADIGKEVIFENSLTGLAYSRTSGPALLRTTDGGATWTPVMASSVPPLRKLTTLPGQANTYLGVNYHFAGTSGPTAITGTTFITRDGGTTWQVLGTDNNKLVNAVALSASEIWATLDYDNGGAGAPPANQQMLLRYSGTALAAKNATDAAIQMLPYPNPTTSTVQLAGHWQGRVLVRIYDAAGRLCQEIEVSETARSIDLTKQPAGLYQLVIKESNGTVRTQRISKL